LQTFIRLGRQAGAPIGLLASEGKQREREKTLPSNRGAPIDRTASVNVRQIGVHRGLRYPGFLDAMALMGYPFPRAPYRGQRIALPLKMMSD
jgi:hypothetical protein